MDFYSLSKVLGVVLVSFVITYSGIPKGQRWNQTKRGFERAPLANLVGVACVLFVLALAAFPHLRPTWFASAVKYASAPIIILFFGSIIWMRRREKQHDEIYVQRKLNSPNFEDNSHRQSDNRDRGDSK